jgi:hypothetical protein
MKVIKTREELLNLLDSNKDLIIDDDVTIEFSTSREDVRNVRCKNLFMAKGNNRFDLSICGNFNGWNFTGVNFTGWNFNGRNFTGWNFNGGDIAYYAFFCCYGKIIKSGKITAHYSKAYKPIESGKD